MHDAMPGTPKWYDFTRHPPHPTSWCITYVRARGSCDVAHQETECLSHEPVQGWHAHALAHSEARRFQYGMRERGALRKSPQQEHGRLQRVPIDALGGGMVACTVCTPSIACSDTLRQQLKVDQHDSFGVAMSCAAPPRPAQHRSHNRMRSRTSAGKPHCQDLCGDVGALQQSLAIADSPSTTELELHGHRICEARA